MKDDKVIVCICKLCGTGFLKDTWHWCPCAFETSGGGNVLMYECTPQQPMYMLYMSRGFTW